MPWSLSQLSKYKQCPSAYDFRHNKKMLDPAGPAAQRGTDIHAHLEHYIETGEWGYEVPAFTRERAENMRACGHKPEAKIALDKDWQVVEWSSPSAWVRGIIDTLQVSEPTAAMGEWKTGKVYPEDHERQRRLYLSLLLSAYPGVNQATIETIYVDHSKSGTRSMNRSELLAEQDYWREEAGPMLRDTFFSPRPGFYCNWCPFSKRKTGPCEF